MIDAYEIIRHFYPEDTPLRQLLLKHSEQVRDKVRFLVEQCCPESVRMQVDLALAENGALLHDIGIGHCHAPSILCNGTEDYLCHGVIGAKMLRDLDVTLEPYARICERHTGSGLTAAEKVRHFFNGFNFRLRFDTGPDFQSAVAEFISIMRSGKHHRIILTVFFKRRNQIIGKYDIFPGQSGKKRFRQGNQNIYIIHDPLETSL